MNCRTGLRSRGACGSIYIYVMILYYIFPSRTRKIFRKCKKYFPQFFAGPFSLVKKGDPASNKKSNVPTHRWSADWDSAQTTDYQGTHLLGDGGTGGHAKKSRTSPASSHYFIRSLRSCFSNAFSSSSVTFDLITSCWIVRLPVPATEKG